MNEILIYLNPIKSTFGKWQGKKISLKDIYVWQVLTCCGDRTVKGRVWMAFSCQSHHQELFLSFSPHSDIFDGKIKNCPSGSESFNHSYFAFHRD